MTTVFPQSDPEILGLVQVEASEYLELMNAELLAIEEQGAKGKVDLYRALRAAHSLKGTAAATGLRAVEKHMHNWESCVQAVQRGDVELDGRGFDLLFRLLDGVSAEVLAACTGTRPKLPQPVPSARELALVFGAELGLEEVREPEQEAGVELAGPLSDALRSARVGDEAQTIRVAVSKVDRLMANVEELVQVKAGGPTRVQEIGHLNQLIESLAEALDKYATRLSNGRLKNDPTRAAAGVDALRALVAQADDAAQASARLFSSLRSHTRTLDSLATRLQDDIRSVRMVPLQAALGSLPRVVRDLGRKLNKQVVLEIRGGDNEMDRDLLEAIKDPLIHLLRNAVAHGVESPEVRRRAGKPETSRVILGVQNYAGGLQLEVRDDGAGVDLAKVRVKANERRLVDGAGEISDRELLDLIFLPGLSTAESVDEISGRGVGLDAVREVVEGCGGRVSVESTPGLGTTFQLRLPVNLATLRMLLVRVGQEQFALPINSVVRILRIRPDQVRQVDAGFAIELEGRAIPVARLDHVLKVGAAATSECRHGLVLASGPDKVALLVDAILGEQELIMKGLGDHLRRVDKIAGATVLATGRIVPLLNVGDIVRQFGATRSGQLFPEAKDRATQKRRILIVDDSITTRTLERSILEAVGYMVEVATDGEDALSKLSVASFDLMLSDVQMPRMDGIALVTRVKQSERTKNMPVVLVSSLDSDEDRRRGLEAGADAYLGKSDFRQELLLETLDRLI